MSCLINLETSCSLILLLYWMTNHIEIIIYIYVENIHFRHLEMILSSSILILSHVVSISLPPVLTPPPGGFWAKALALG